MSQRRALSILATAASLAFTGCGGDDGDGNGSGDDPTPATTAPSEVPSGAPAPSPGALPPQLLECFEEKGFEVESTADIHSAPPAVVQKCFQSLHGGG